MFQQVVGAFSAAIVILSIPAAIFFPEAAQKVVGSASFVSAPAILIAGLAVFAAISAMTCWAINCTEASRRSFCVGALIPILLLFFGNDLVVSGIMGLSGNAVRTVSNAMQLVIFMTFLCMINGATTCAVVHWFSGTKSEQAKQVAQHTNALEEQAEQAR